MKAPVPSVADGLTLADISEALKAHRTSVLRRSDKEGWPFYELARAGKAKRLYPLVSLPKDVREACQTLLIRRAMGAVAPSPSIPLPQGEREDKPKPVAIRAPISREAADAAQLIVQEARICILNTIAKAVAQSRISETAAINAWLQAITDGSMPHQQVLWCALANAKNGFRWTVSFASGHPVAVADDRVAEQDLYDYAAKLSLSTIRRWIAQRELDGDDALIPGKRTKDMSVPAWAGLFLDEMQRPQKPSLQSAYERMAERLRAEGWQPHLGKGIPGPTIYPDYGSVCRWYREKFSALDKQKGRNTGSALNPFKFHHVRTSEGMEPLQEVHSDGWATKFYAPHPISGKWVTGEVWHSHDVATRKAYVHERSIGLSETTPVILGSLYAVSVEDGEPLFWQTDNTGAVKNARVEFDPAASLAARRNIQIVHNIPGNSQANGIAESFNRYLQERSKALATYKGGDMDALAKNRVHKLTNKLAKAGAQADGSEVARIREAAAKAGCGLVFGTWAEARDWVIKVVREFNDLPHRSLPKITDSNGKRRHMSPNERMAEFIADGWQRKPLSGDELLDAFRVHEVKRVTRGCVSVMGQKYHHTDLDHFNGEDVLVAYDIEDGERVFIKDIAGVPMCEAAFYESRGYRAQSFVEIALEKRADKQIGRLNKKVAAIEEQRPGATFETVPAFGAIESTAVRVEEASPLSPALSREAYGSETAETHTPRAGVVPAEVIRQRRINQMEDPDLLRHLAAHPADWTVPRARYLLEQAAKIAPLYRQIDEMGLWGTLNRAAHGVSEAGLLTEAVTEASQQANQGNFERRAVGC